MTQVNSTISLDEKVEIAAIHLLERAVIDIEFRQELLSRPEEFGLTQEKIESFKLPIPVEEQDLSFVELVTEETNSIVSCRTTCVSGWTLRCDGTTL